MDRVVEGLGGGDINGLNEGMTENNYTNELEKKNPAKKDEVFCD